VVVVVGAGGFAVVVVVGAGGFAVVVVVGAGGFVVVVVVGAGRGDGLPGLAKGVETTWEGEEDETVTGAAAHPLTATLSFASPLKAATK
jgi:hypothetical protein